jgi:hypothetical protein
VSFAPLASGTESRVKVSEKRKCRPMNMESIEGFCVLLWVKVSERTRRSPDRNCWKARQSKNTLLKLNSVRDQVASLNSSQ